MQKKYMVLIFSNIEFSLCSAWGYGFELKLRVFTKPYSSAT